MQPGSLQYSQWGQQHTVKYFTIFCCLYIIKLDSTYRTRICSLAYCTWRACENINIWFPFMFPQKWNCYFQIRIILFCLSVPTLIYLWEIYIFPGSDCLFSCREICGQILGIYKSITDTCMWRLGLRPRNSQKRNTKMVFSLQCRLQYLQWGQQHTVKYFTVFCCFYVIKLDGTYRARIYGRLQCSQRGQPHTVKYFNIFCCLNIIILDGTYRTRICSLACCGIHNGDNSIK